VSWFRSSPITDIALKANFETKTTLKLYQLLLSRSRNSLMARYQIGANFGIGTVAAFATILAGPAERIAGLR
jgi:hypothetical protein